jgi:hypothetical protein
MAAINDKLCKKQFKTRVTDIKSLQLYANKYNHYLIGSINKIFNIYLYIALLFILYLFGHV